MTHRDNDMSKGNRRQAAAAMDIWESRYVRDGVMKRDAKRAWNRAERRLGKAIIREQIAAEAS